MKPILCRRSACVHTTETTGRWGFVATQRWEMEKRGAVLSHAEQGKLRNRRRRIELGLVSGKASSAVSQPGGARRSVSQGCAFRGG